MSYHIPLTPHWRRLLGLHHREYALIGPNGDVRIKYGCPQRHHRGPYCDRCGHTLLLPDGTVTAGFEFNRPGLAYVDCRVCGTRNTRASRVGIYG